ncbi:hypothetical protein ACT453_45305, partial [Bacillus sp. D-CC]
CNFLKRCNTVSISLESISFITFPSPKLASKIPLQEEKPPVVQIPKKEEKVNDLIKEPLKEKERITYVIKEPLTDNKEENKAKAQKDKDNNQVISKK